MINFNYARYVPSRRETIVNPPSLGGEISSKITVENFPTSHPRSLKLTAGILMAAAIPTEWQSAFQKIDIQLRETYMGKMAGRLGGDLINVVKRLTGSERETRPMNNWDWTQMERELTVDKFYKLRRFVCQ